MTRWDDCWDDWARTQLRDIRDLQQLREPVVFDADGPEGTVRGRRVISYASNDYLGLASHPQVRAAAHAAIERFGTGARAARLVVGTRSLHCELEAALASWKNAEHALLFSSGYAANLGVLATLAQADVTVFSDALNHASIIDGCRLARARTVVYRHLDMEHLSALLSACRGRKLVITETVFSMDGDHAPVADLLQLCARHDALLILDEAHAVFDVEQLEAGGATLRIGTLSKMLGALGGYVTGSSALIDLLTNRARTFIFTTALSPADTAAAFAALQIVRSEAGAALRRRLRESVDALRPGHPSAILPVILGDEQAALAAAAQLYEIGIHVPAIRPPTVPPGTARLRIALSSAHTNEMLARLHHGLERTLAGGWAARAHLCAPRHSPIHGQQGRVELGQNQQGSSTASGTPSVDSTTTAAQALTGQSR